VTPVTYDQSDIIAPSSPLDGPLDGPTVIATVSCHHPDTTVCRVAGSVDLLTAPVLAGKLSDVLHEGRPHFVIDLSAVALLDAIGLQIVVEALGSCEVDGHLAIVVDPCSATFTRPDITALGEVIDVHHDLGGALRACAQASISPGGRHRAAATG